MTTENLGNLTVRINGPDLEEYASSDFDLQNIPYDGAVSIYFVTKINFDLTTELVEDKSPYTIIVHNVSDDIYTRNVDSFDIVMPDDGYYEIISLIIPTKIYVEDGLGYIPGSNVKDNLDTNIIVADVSNEDNICFKILQHTYNPEEGYYSHTWTEWLDISLEDILLLLAQEEELNIKSSTTIKKLTKSVFVYDKLYKCYINKANELLSIYSGEGNICASNSLCDNTLNKYKSLIQIRDYLWMAVNVIKYCIQNCLYLKALKVLNCVSSCAGICPDTNLTKTNKIQKGCGCSKRN